MATDPAANEVTTRRISSNFYIISVFVELFSVGGYEE